MRLRPAVLAAAILLTVCVHAAVRSHWVPRSAVFENSRGWITAGVSDGYVRFLTVYGPARVPDADHGWHFPRRRFPPRWRLAVRDEGGGDWRFVVAFPLWLPAALLTLYLTVAYRRSKRSTGGFEVQKLQPAPAAPPLT